MALIVDQAGVPVTPSEFPQGLRVLETLKWLVAICAVVLISVAWAVALAVLLWWAS